ncbi:hypothetical protein B566_EDAN011372 [Ephemera danica]|nr:hypothetical protein B566_EDAN011372 [Ephemera danica]
MNNLVLLVITASVLAVYLIYSKLVRTYEYWGRKGVRSVTPTFLIGNMGPVLLRKTSMIENFQQCYNECKRSKFGGFYEFLTPLFMPIDPELIRDMSVKNFDHFSDRRGFVNEKCKTETSLESGFHSSAISDDDIAAQAFLFFLAGFETVSILLSFLTHELAVNPEIQERLRAELDATIAAQGGKLTYESVHNMQYLDMVVSETLRKNPPAPITDRTCTKNYIVPGTDVLIEEGSSILLPIYALHHDPEFFPEPEKFDPERFSKENKKNIRPYTYLPFGSGPHNCLGMRLALLEVKLCICYILDACELKVSAKTQVPLKLTKKSFRMQPDDGFWVSAIPRPQASLTTL